MDNPLLKLQNAQDSMSATEANIAAYILAQPKVVRHLTVRELSKATYSSASSVLRVCRQIGYSGYREFQNALAEELAALKDEGYDMVCPVIVCNSKDYQKVTGFTGSSVRVGDPILKIEK